MRSAVEVVESDPDAAFAIASKYLSDHPDEGYAKFILGYIYLQGEHFGIAYSLFQQCTEYGSEVFNNMGMCVDTAEPLKAIGHFSRALELNPKNNLARINLAVAYMKAGEPKKAVNQCNAALRHDPGSVNARYNRGLNYLMLREWEKGWRDYSIGLGQKSRVRRDYGLPEWDGEAGRVLVYGEQGIGDEIMFATCIPDLLKTNEVVIDTEPRLAGLFDRTFGCPVYGTRLSSDTPALEAKPDYQIAMGELPRHFRNSASDFPGSAYLKVDPERRVQWKALLDTKPGRKVGLAWTGGIQVTGKKRRSFSAMDYFPLLNDSDTFVSLEYLEPDLQDLPIHHWRRAVAKGVDFEETVALVSCLDFVVTCCTTTVYIAGALGIPCYVLVPELSSYRYHSKGEFPWFNSVKLIRQGKGEDWRSVVDRVAGIVNQEAAA